MKCVACFAVLTCVGALAQPIHAQQPAEGSVIITFEPKKDDFVRPADVVKDRVKLAVAQLKVRLDSAVSGVAVRPTAEGRIEIVVPPKMKGKDLTAADVQRIKDLVGAVGHLEFLMLANSVDDVKAIRDAQRQIGDPVNQNELADRQKEGLPPLGPRSEAKVPTRYSIVLAKLNKSKSIVTYRWVELGTQEIKMLKLDDEESAAWKTARRERGRATTLPYSENTQKQLLQGALFYSRECLNRHLTEEQRKARKVDYFVLVRDPEIDPTDPERVKYTPSLNGSLLKSVNSGKDASDHPSVHFEFNAQGGRLFNVLTTKNTSTKDNEDNPIRRHLGIVLDGQVLSAPSISSPINTKGQISGNFTKEEVDNLVKILRSGALPVRLLPISETTVGKQKK